MIPNSKVLAQKDTGQEEGENSPTMVRISPAKPRYAPDMKPPTSSPERGVFCFSTAMEDAALKMSGGVLVRNWWSTCFRRRGDPAQGNAVE